MPAKAKKRSPSTYWKQQEQLMELAQSRGGVAANLAGQSTERLLDARAWIDWLLGNRRKRAK